MALTDHTYYNAVPKYEIHFKYVHLHFFPESKLFKPFSNTFTNYHFLQNKIKYLFFKALH